MILTAVLVVAAVLVLGGKPLVDKVRDAASRVVLPKLEGKHVAGAALLAAAAIAYGSRAAPAPNPAPQPDEAGIVLRGKFVGPDAAADAAVTAALLDELAAEIEWDGMSGDPLIRTGQQIDQLRVRARELRCRGISLGEKHPRAREAIKDFLDKAAGTSGGPLSPEQRAAWVSAYREVARAAADAAR